MRTAPVGDNLREVTATTTTDEHACMVRNSSIDPDSTTVVADATMVSAGSNDETQALAVNDDTDDNARDDDVDDIVGDVLSAGNGIAVIPSDATDMYHDAHKMSLKVSAAMQAEPAANAVFCIHFGEFYFYFYFHFF
jgi:hypothetical protein